MGMSEKLPKKLTEELPVKLSAESPKAGILSAISGFLVLGFLFSCSHNPNKAEKISTQIENKGQLSGETSVGVKDGNMVVQRKVVMSEELRRIQYEVYELEDRVYGNRKYGSDGSYGVLKKCRDELAKKDNGGEGKLKFQEPIDRITDKEDDMKLGLDEKSQLVGVSEEFLKERIERFRGYKMILQKREDEYDDKLRICRNDLENKKFEKKAN
jgi:hypothetical protein